MELRREEKLSAMHQGNRASEEVKKMREKEAQICVQIESLEVRAAPTCWRCREDPESMTPKSQARAHRTEEEDGHGAKEEVRFHKEM